MIIEKNKTNKILSIAIILILALSTSLMLLPAANASTFPTHAFLSVTPSPVGVGQQLTLVMWLDIFPPYVLNGTDRLAIGHWDGYAPKVTKPDGTTQSLGTFNSDPIAGAYTFFTPSTVGTYYFEFSFPGQTVLPSQGGTYYGPSTSSKVAVTVQDQLIAPWPAAPLPKDYWNRPIEAENREWASIASNWLGVPLINPGSQSGYNASGKFNPYTTAPNTAHIVWNKPLMLGGIVGDQFGEEFFYSGESYENKMVPTVILGGRLYYNIPVGNTPTGGGFACVDLRTGQQLWQSNGTITVGQLLAFDTGNQHGVTPYLWGISSAGYNMYDASSGKQILNIASVSTGIVTFDQTGNLLVYLIDSTHHWFALWNSTLCIQANVPAGQQGSISTATNVQYWRPPVGATLSWKLGIQWNVTTPNVQGITSINPISPTGAGLERINGDVLYCRVIYSPVGIARGVAGEYRETAAGDPDAFLIDVAYNMKTGAQMWVQNRTGEEAFSEEEASFSATIGDGVFAIYKQQTQQWYGYDVYTGAKVWGPTEAYTHPWGMFVTTIGDGPACVAYGKLYATAYDGIVHCFDMKTGTHLWDSTPLNSGLETPYGTWPFFGSYAIADGKIFVGTGEHSPGPSLWRGERLQVFDANTGASLWSLLGWWQYPVIVDGYIVAFNNYDNQIYALGKGQSATTVQTPLTATTSGSEITITGTVYDKSPDAPANTPAVSKDSMEQFMEYLYMQKPQPTNTTGVPVNLVAIDSKGGSTAIGTVTTDGTGFFATHWKVPDTADTYKIIADFAGDDSYGSSSAISAITVVVPSPTSTPLTASDVASQVVSQLPTPVPATPAPTIPSASDVASQVVSQLPSISTMDMILLAIVVVIAILVVVDILSVRKLRK